MNQHETGLQDEFQEDEFDLLNDSIRQSIKHNGYQDLDMNNISMDREEINTIYSELEASIASKQKKLIAVANEPCSVCQKKPKGNASCIVLSE